MPKNFDINLLPGELYIGKKPQLVRTILGSCLSVIMHNERLKIGAICHAQLPEEKGVDHCYANCPVKCMNDSPDTNKFKYVTCSIEYMLNEMTKLGSSPNELQVRLFGGANMITMKSQNSIGSENIAVAHKILKDKGLKIKAEDLGGTSGRVLLFQTDSGEILLRRLKANMPAI